jgi:large subunit ribosomal protein L10
MKTIDDKKAIVSGLVEELNSANHFYVIDIATLNAQDTSNLRRKCFEKGIKLIVVKNTLLKKALEQKEGDFEAIYSTLKGNSAVMICDTANVPAKLIKEIRSVKGKEKPVLKAAFVEQSAYVGDTNLDTLATLKSKNELIGDIILILQSPMQTVLSQLNSGKNILGGVVKTLQERAS